MKKITLFIALFSWIFSGLNGQTIFYEDFQAGMPSNFILINNDGHTPASQVSWVNQAWVTHADFNNTADTCAVSTSWYSPAAASDDWMIIPKQSISAGDFLIWRGWAPDQSYADGYEVKISTTDSAMSSFTSNLAVISAEGDPWVWHAVDLSSYSGQNVWIAFRNNSNDKFLLFIDDITIKHLDSFDIAGLENTMTTPNGLNNAPFSITGVIQNNGSQAITSFDLNYTVNGGSVVTSNITGVNIPVIGKYSFTHPTQWTPTAAGTYTIKIWASNINGHADQNAANDTITANISIASQSTQRMPLYEEFTSSTCAPCAAGNAAMTPVLNANSGKWVMVKYQMSWPGSGDPYYTAEGGVRRQFYGVNAVPDLYVDGTTNLSPSQVSATGINQAYGKPSFVSLSAELTINYDHSIDLDVSINPLVDINNSKLFVAIVERKTFNNVKSNGETEFHYVMKKMLPNANGTAVTLTNGNTLTKNFNYKFKGNYRLPSSAGDPINHNIEHSVENFDSLVAVVWLQNTTTKEVYQAAMSTVATGIDNIENASINAVYPNPATDMMNVKFSLKNSASVSYTIVNNLGQVVLSENLGTLSAGNHNERIDVSSLSSGLYMFSMLIDGKIVTKKISIR